MNETNNNLKKMALAEKRHRQIVSIKKNWILYLFLLPMCLYVILFDYIPMYGLQIAFKDYRPIKGIWGSPWVGFEHFVTFFTSYQFWDLLKNTLSISLYSLVVGFPMPIIFALVLNYVNHKRFRKMSQMITYAPHFISMVVYCGMILVFLSNEGVVNQILKLMGGNPVQFMAKPEYFIHVYVWSGVLKSVGWGSIMYISVLTSVPTEQYEAATIDGATKFQKLLNIDIPALVPTIIIMLIMRTGEIMSIGFEKAFLLQNSVNLANSEIISTYVYKIGIQGGQFSYSSAIGLFNNLINFLLLIAVNRIANKTSEVSLW